MRPRARHLIFISILTFAVALPGVSSSADAKKPPTSRERGSSRMAAESPGAMERFLSAVRKYQRDSSRVLGEVEARVTAARHAMESCTGPRAEGEAEVRGGTGAPESAEIRGAVGIGRPAGSSGSGMTRIRPLLPYFAVTRPIDSSYYPLYARRCDKYPHAAETAVGNARRHFRYLARHVDEVNRMIDFLGSYCDDWDLLDSDDTSLDRKLTSLLGSATTARDRFAGYVTDVERFKRQYEDCLKDEATTNQDSKSLDRTRPGPGR